MENGKLNLNELPSTVQLVKVTASKLNQKLQIGELPQGITSLIFENVTFNSGDAVVEHSVDLKRFVCRYCGLTSISFPAKSGLQELDLSGNTLTTVLPSPLPGSELALIMQNCTMNMSLTNVLKLLPRNVHTIDFSYSKIPDIQEGIAKLPSHLQTVKLNGCHLGAEVSSLTDALKSASESIQELALKDCGLTGGLGKLRHFGPLRSLDLSSNRISSVAWEELPPALEHLSIGENALVGGLPVRRLPRSLRLLDVSHNGLSGGINVGELPPTLTTLDISHNNFTGHLDLTQLPDSILYVHVEHNGFQGTPDLVEIPIGIRKIMIHDNNWDSLLPAL
ncbi:leucine-rich repeat protein [Trypanosoma conorhini]|uniref:Leucine-rich repeat protein n=1 Tax=Trypanosoma conorhini TaxID=83891 RepID=A0A422P0E3_9TRYP|nr:leucine-rich repeat protein [Trypanosoma conorhini]RNF11212.1 leucine-rich repeat protein [Trypanosoma conorhini]